MLNYVNYMLTMKIIYKFQIPSHHVTPLPLSHDNLSLKLAERGLTKTKTVSVDLQSEQSTPVVEYGETIITMEGTNVVVSGLPVVKSSPDFVIGSAVHFQHEEFSLDSSTQTDLTGDDIDRSKIDGLTMEMTSIKRALLKDQSHRVVLILGTMSGLHGRNRK